MLLAILLGPIVAGAAVGLGFALRLPTQPAPDALQQTIIISVLFGAILGFGFGLIPTAIAVLVAFLTLPHRAVSTLRFGITAVAVGVVAGEISAAAASSSMPGLTWTAAAVVPASMLAAVSIWYCSKALRFIVPSVTPSAD